MVLMKKPINFMDNDIKLEMYPNITIIFYKGTDNVFYSAIGYSDFYSVDLDWDDNVINTIVPAKCLKTCFSIDSDKFRKNAFKWFRTRTNLGLLSLEQELSTILEDNSIYPFESFEALTKTILKEQHLKFNSEQQCRDYFNLGKIIDPDVLKDILQVMYDGFVYAIQEAVPTTTKGEQIDEENNI